MAEERPLVQRDGIPAVADVGDIVGGDRRGRLERPPHRLELVEIALAESPRFQQQAVAAGPGRQRLLRRRAAVENVVILLPLDRLKCQPADIARPKLQNANRRQGAVPGGNDDVFSIRADLAVVEEHGDDDGVRLSRGDFQGTDGVEVHARPAKRLLRPRRRRRPEARRGGKEKNAKRRRSINNHCRIALHQLM